MLKNFLIVTFRQLFKNKIYVGINIVGLGLALACCIVAYQNAKYDWDFD
ncbi:MAG: putative ABC transport system permease protein, partial [Cyclobacteriaceae bacterium]